MLYWCLPCRLDLIHICCRWPQAQLREEAFESRARPLSNYFHVAVALIACVPAQSKGLRSLDDKVAKAHTLDAPSYDCMQFLMMDVTLAHDTHDSIGWFPCH